MIERIRIIELEWNQYNGFCFEVLSINDYSLFDIGISRDYFIIQIGFLINITFFERTR
jgi:hypothetical protein